MFPRNGQFGFGSAEYITADAVADIYKLLGFDAIAVGGNDLSGGLGLLRESSEQGVPWTSANIVDDDENLLFAPYRIKSIDTISIAIIGITGPATVGSGEFVIKEPLGAVAQVLGELEDGYDLIMLLAAMPTGDTVSLVEHFPQIDIVIGADNGRGNLTPYLVDTTLITQTADRGRYQGVLSINWNGKPLGESRTTTFVTLRKRLKSINRQLSRLQQSPWDTASQKGKIDNLKKQRSEISAQIEHLEKEVDSGSPFPVVSTYEFQFLPLSPSGRVDPQIDSIIRDAKRRVAGSGKK